MTVYQYAKTTKNNNIFNKMVAYNILQCIKDLKFDSLEKTNIINLYVDSLQNLSKHCDKSKIAEIVKNNINNYKGKILTSYEELDKTIL